MRRYGYLIGGLVLVFVALFLAVEWLQVPLLIDPQPWLGSGGWMAATLGVFLLVIDVLVPVPSSLVMVAHGALFGVLVGTVISLLGSVGATAFGFFLGRRGAVLLARVVSADERRRANRLIERWGALAVLVSRPLPILAETVAIVAGSSLMGWGRLLAAAVAGSLPAALLYALTGATAVGFDSFILIFLLVSLVAGLFYFAARRLERS